MACMYVSWLLLTQTLLLLVVSKLPKHEAKVPAIIVFGDSSVDSGNNNRISTLLKSNFKPYGRDFPGGQPTGRFSNGRLPPDFISEAFGLKPSVPAYLDPAFRISDFIDGVCFASAGTGYDNATSDALNVIPLWKEVEYYKEYQNKLRDYVGQDKATKILTQALYLISLGTNDFLENYYAIPRRRNQFTVQQYQDFLVGLAENFMREIYSLGVRNVALTGVPPMGCLPLERATNFINRHECVEEHNKVAVEFNGKLNNMAAKLNEELEGYRVQFTSKVYDFLYHIITNPSSYGFDVAEVACCSMGTFEMGYLCNENNPLTCTNANKYVFWDSFHSTDRTNQLVANFMTPDLMKSFS